MKFWRTSFYLLYILNYVEVAVSNQMFYAMTLSDSGLLIFWDPATIENVYKKDITVDFRIFNETSANISSESASCKYGQYKIQSVLMEDSLYEINITIGQTDDPDAPKSVQPGITCKTGSKNNSVPAKPHFKWQVSSDFNTPYIRINWIPCGEERNCHGKEAGSHFAIKFKILDLRETVTIVEYEKDFYEIFVTCVGKIYELAVVSINGDFEAESDTQEVVYMPSSGPVHSVRVLVLTNTSLYISWEKPRISTFEVTVYDFSYAIYNSMNVLNWDEFKKSGKSLIAHDFPVSYRANYLTPNMTYTFLMFPCNASICGLDYKLDFTIHPIQPNLTLAKPDFRISEVTKRGNICSFRVFWLPCIEIFDCKNMSPGSGFELKIEGSNIMETFTEERSTSTIIEFKAHPTYEETYKVIGKSVDEFDQSSENVTKTILC